MTPVEELRAAAALIRELAQAATPGPWRRHDTHLDWGGRAATVLSGEDDRPDLRAWLPTFGQERNVWNDAAHISSWHPMVTLTVADWLDATADGWVIPDPHDAGEYCPECRVFHAALKVARAYLRAGAREAVSGG